MYTYPTPLKNLNIRKTANVGANDDANPNKPFIVIDQISMNLLPCEKNCVSAFR